MIDLRSIIEKDRILRLILTTLMSIDIPIKINEGQIGIYLRALMLGFILSMMGYLLALILTIGGVTILAMGISGNITWIVEAGEASSKLYNASPGIVMIIAALFIVWISRYRIKAVAA